MSTKFTFAVACLFLALPAVGQKQKQVKFEITPPVQAELDKWKATAFKWANDPFVVGWVVKANAKGPYEGVDNKAWKKLSKKSPKVLPLRLNPVAKHLSKKMKASAGAVSEMFLNGDKGHKVCFAAKTSSYIHAGKSKFDVPFKQNKFWQGKPEADKSTKTYQVQISVPVHAAGDKKKPRIGVLVLGINLSHLAKVAARPAK